MSGSAEEERRPLGPEAVAHYASGYEATRVTRGGGRLEYVRTQELVHRFVPPAPAVVLDVGGGPGAYALWLAALGYAVHLVDALPLHVELARQASAAQPTAPLASVSLGDARTLAWPDHSADALLLFGPLYHLTARSERVAALREARRIVRPGGVVLAIGISRFASTLDGLFSGFLADPAFVEIIRYDLEDGQHRNPTGHPAYFTTAYFHRPEELGAEVVEAGLIHETTLAVEGPAWLSPWVADHWHSQAQRDEILHLVRRLEHEPSVLGASAHLMVVARTEATDRN
jgi:ubiquinone/menaquinone biosynthesis C-methylase UbiE